MIHIIEDNRDGSDLSKEEWCQKLYELIDYGKSAIISDDDAKIEDFATALLLFRQVDAIP